MVLAPTAKDLISYVHSPRVNQPRTKAVAAVASSAAVAVAVVAVSVAAVVCIYLSTYPPV